MGGWHYREEMTQVRAPRVLVVDDAASIRLLIRTNLELAGFEVEEVEDGVACMTYLAAAGVLPDVVTLDVMMPKQGGLATAAAIRSDPRTAGVGIVMVTTQNLPSDIARGERVGVDAYLTKPFDPDELVATVKTVALRAAERIA
jgi:CheY-like chemotaxis protein